MRVRVLPVVGTMPAIMGQTLAAMALCELGGKPFSPVGAERVGRNVRHKLYQHLRSREKKLQDKLMAELWKNKCAISGTRLGTTLELYRWDMTKPATPNNLVLLSVKSAQKFEKDFEELGDGRKGVDNINRARIEKRLTMCVLDAEDE